MILAIIPKQYRGYALAGGVLFVAYTAYKAKKGAEQVVEAVNPASDKNIVYKSASELMKTVTGDEHATLGTAIYDLIN